MNSPTTSTELAEIVTRAHGDRAPLIVTGNGSKLNWGDLVVGANDRVTTNKLDRPIAHAVGDLTVTVEAGMRLAQLQSMLAAEGQFLPIDPAYPNQATIGGIISTADTGSLRHRYGGVRDLVLGITFVRADGKIAKAGGRVVKNVAGYDLMKLFTGAYGTLGILTEVTLRLYPLPTDSATVMLTGQVDALAQVARTLLGSSLTPTAVDLVSTGLSLQLDISNTPSLIARFQTIPVSIEEQSAQLLTWGKQLGLKGGTWRGAQETNLWHGIQTSIWDRCSTGETGPTAIGCKLGVKSTAAAETIAMFDRLTEGNELAVIHIGSGIGACSLASPQHINPLRQQCTAANGFLSILQAPDTLKQEYDVWGFRGDGVRVMKQLKQKFDPYGILNPGKYF
jgi:glycolate oxidase FAD binding subunit